MAMNVFTAFQKSKSRFFILTSALCLFTATSTQAGFEWIPASPKTEAPPAAAPAPVNSDNLLMHEEQPLSPLPGEELPPMPAPIQAMPIDPPAQQPVIKVKKMNVPDSAAPQPLKPADTAMQEPAMKTRVVMPQDAPDSAVENMPQGEVLSINPYPAEKTAAPAAAPMPDFDHIQNTEVVGFGSDMPLALALQQIAPPGYAFSFGEDINPGAKVSWTGGKGWIDVMQEMIAPLDLSADIRGKAIFIHHQQQSYNAAPVPAPVEPADAPEAPEGIAPASGPEAVATEEPMPVIRRNAIQDPGIQPQEQPEETLSFLESNPPHPEDARVPAGNTVWQAEKGDSLKQTLDTWSKTAGFKLEWNAQHDYELQSDILVAGQLDTALKNLLLNGVDHENGPNITFIKGGNGQSDDRLIIEGRSS